MLLSAPNNTDAKINKALCLIDMTRKDEAKEILEQIVQLGGKNKVRAENILQKSF
jgi:hypothetical protein